MHVRVLSVAAFLHSRAFAGLAFSLTGALAVAVLPQDIAAGATPAEAARSAGAVATSAPLERPDSVSAMVTARSGHRRVEDLSQRDEVTRVFANPNGTWTAETASEPERVQEPDGRWYDIDTSLQRRDGGLAPAHALSDVMFSDGGDHVFASMTSKGEKVTWRWPGTLPKPTVKGDTATYADVLPGADLVVTADGTGFTHSLVLRQAPTKPVRLTIPVDARGGVQKTAQGGLEIQGRSGKTVVSSSQALMWDSSKNEVGDSEHVAPVETGVTTTAAGKPAFTLTPDTKFLEDPDTVYPVTIDPSFTTYTNGDVWVENPNYTTGQVSSSELRVGTYDGGGHVARAFLHFGTTAWNGKHVQSAKLVLRNYYSGSCTGAVIRASRITSSWDGNTLTWGNQPNGGSAYTADYSPAHGYNSTCDSADATWTITDMVQDWADGAFTNNGIKLKAPDETSIYTWRRYRSANYSTSSVRPHINVTYNSYPDKPGTPSVSPGNTGYATSTTPTFKATVSDPDKSSVRGIFEVYQGSTLKWTGTSSYVASGSTASITVPSGKLVDGTTYTVKVKANDGTDSSKSYSSSTTFTVDTTKPNLTTQDITSTVFTDGQWHADPATSNTFTFNGPSDTKSFTYVEDGVTQPVKSADSSGDATISWLPKDGWHTLTVTAIDKAGNPSSTKATFSFGYGLASFITTNAAARSTGVFPIQLASRPDATDATLSWRYAGTTTWHKADGVTKNGQPWNNAVANSADNSQSLTGALLWEATAQVEDASASPQKTITAPALLELRTCFNYTTSPTQICSSALPVQLVPNAFGGNFPTTNLGPAQVALATGEMTFTEPDAVDSTAGVARTFSSFDTSTVQTGPFGPGWSSTLLADGDTSAQLLDHHDQDGTFVLVTAGNASQTYTLEPSTGLYMPVGTDDGSRLSVGADTATLTRPQTSTTSWKLQNGAWVIDTATSTDAQGATPIVDVTSDKPGYPTWIAQTAPGVSTTCTETQQAEGCRGLKISYAGSGDQTRVTKIELFTHDGSSTVATYSYNSNNELKSVCGADPDGSGQLTSLCASYTYQPVAGRTLVASATPPGQTPWTFAYDNEGRLATVSRPLDPDTNTGSGPATWTVRYDLTPTTAGLPDMSAASIDRWGQATVPAKVYAVFDPSDPNTTDLTYADLYYTDEADKTTNTAVHANVSGVSQWLLDTTWYDDNDNVTQTLDGAGRAQALAETTLAAQQTAAVAASSFTLYNQKSTATASPGQDGTQPASTTDGVRVQDEYGPVHTVTLKDGTTGPYRTHTAYVYDDQDPNLGGGSKPALDEGQTSFNLVVEERHSASDAERANDYDTTLVRYDYDPIVAGDGNGWSLSTPTRTKVQLSNGSWSTSVTRVDSDGRQVETRQPGGATDANGAGTDAHATVTRYYTKNAADTDCDTTASAERASWVGLLCKTGPAGQPTGPSMPVTYQKAYDADLRPTTVLETSGTTTRTTTTAYDLLGRVTSSTLKDGNDTRTTTMTYDTASGAATGQSNASGAVTTQVDTWGRPSSYTDASGLVSTITYTAEGQVATRDDGLGVYTYSYDTAPGEHRRLPDSVDVGLATGTSGAFDLTYDATGAQSQVTYPNGMTANYGYDEAGFPTSLDYTDGTGNPLLSFANSVDVDGRVLTAGSDASEQSYSYDNAGRLTKVEDTRDGQCTTRTYGFSAASERTSFNSYGADVDGNCQTATATVSKTNTYDTANRIRNTGYTYDDLGRTLTMPASDTAPGGVGDLTLSYYANDMVQSMRQTIDDGTGGTLDEQTSYGLDPTGRISTVTNSTGGIEESRLRYRFSDDSDSPTSIQTSSDAGASWTATRYLTVPGLGVVGSVDNGAVAYHLANLHGDLVATSAGTGVAPAIDTYTESDEYGNAIQAASNQRYGWLGSHQRSKDTLGGLVLMGARVYNPATGVFLTPDSVRGGNLNAFTYPLDPVNQLDLTGLWHWIKVWYRYGYRRAVLRRADDLYTTSDLLAFLNWIGVAAPLGGGLISGSSSIMKSIVDDFRNRLFTVGRMKLKVWSASQGKYIYIRPRKIGLAWGIQASDRGFLIFRAYRPHYYIWPVWPV